MKLDIWNILNIWEMERLYSPGGFKFPHSAYCANP